MKIITTNKCHKLLLMHSLFRSLLFWKLFTTFMQIFHEFPFIWNSFHWKNEKCFNVIFFLSVFGCNSSIRFLTLINSKRIQLSLNERRQVGIFLSKERQVNSRASSLLPWVGLWVNYVHACVQKICRSCIMHYRLRFFGKNYALINLLTSI